jgi:hypothetical protein
MPRPETLRVRHALTATPLARLHEHELATGQVRRRPKIPWASFRRDRYPEAALALAADAQKNLAIGEYGSIDLFAWTASALALNGAPFDVVAAATRMLADECRHAELCLRMASLCAGRDLTIPVNRFGFGGKDPRPLELGELDLVFVEVAAIGETLAAALLDACRRRARDAVARALFTSLLGDEVHHARIGWYYFAWRAPQWRRAERQRVADHAGEMVADVETRFWTGRDAPAAARPAAAALGVLDSPSQRETIRRVMEDEIVPALDALGLGASHAWRVRKRGGA